MSEQQSNHPSLIPLRRKDRAIGDEAWIEQLLEATPFATMATNGAEYPHLHSNTFYYDPKGRAIYFHTSIQGATRNCLAGGCRVTFAVATMGRLLPAKTATQMSVEYQSVQVRGEVIVVDEMEEKREKMQKLVDKYFPHLVAGKDYMHISDPELNNITVYKIRIDEWIGKRKSERDNFAGAFNYQK